MDQGTFQAITMIAYFVAMIIIGLWAYTRTTDLDDYMLGGRQLGPFASALSAGASDMSGWLLMGLPGALYLSGFVEFWIAIGLTAGAWANWKFVAPRLRTYTEVSDNSITVPSFLSNRLKDSRRILRIVGGVIILVFFTFYVSSGMVAGGKFFHASFGMSFHLGLSIVAGVTILYTLVGGFLAVSYTDVVQGIMMLTALLFVPTMAIAYLGGPSGFVHAVSAVDPHAWAMVGASTTLIGIVSAIAWGLGYFGQPHIIVRFMALRSPRQAANARRIGIGWMLLACVGSGLTAMAGIAIYHRDKAQLKDPETVFIALGQKLFHPAIVGFMLAAILAAIMSTISSQLLVSSSALVEDIYLSVSKRPLKKSTSVLLGRLAVLMISLIAAALAWPNKESILAIVAFAWAGFGASFGPLVILSLYFRKLTTWGAVAGMTVGAVTVGIWGNLKGGIFDLYEILPGFALNLVVAIVVSLLTYQPNKVIQQEFDEHVRLLTEFEEGTLSATPQE